MILNEAWESLFAFYDGSLHTLLGISVPSLFFVLGGNLPLQLSYG